MMQFDSKQPFLGIAMGALAACVAIAWKCYGQTEKQSSSADTVVKDVSASDKKKKSQREHLVNECRGNAEQAERLIQYEMRKDNNISTSEAIERAIWRLGKDNRL